MDPNMRTQALICSIVWAGRWWTMQLQYDVLVIGGGLSGLTAAALLAKRKLSVAVIDKGYMPGGSCGAFKRNDAIFDQGSAMLYGFGEQGFNAHRFVFNCLEEPIDIIKHDLLYCVHFKGQVIRFWTDVDRFAEELGQVFPAEKEAIRRFYRDMQTLYQHVMVENQGYTTADETPPAQALRSVLKHPVSYLRFISYLNRSARSLLARYFRNPAIFQFFDKLTSTYCYTTVAESPAILAAVMFIDNHVGGSYYPAGSTLFLPGKLEKAIEENGGVLLMEQEAEKIIFRQDRPSGVRLQDGREIMADNLIYSGTVWNLYGKLIDPAFTTPRRQAWAARQVPTYPSVVLYARVDRSIIPEGTQPVEMLVGNPDQIDESEVTVYLFSLDDHTLCDPDSHVLMAIGPSFEDWSFSETAGAAVPTDYRENAAYLALKAKEQLRLFAVLEKRFPGFTASVRHAELATPRTIERYTLKNGGAVAGPKQSLGQHMFCRLHTRSEWDTLFCCGESTVMGTGTPTVTTSGISAANAILRKLKRPVYSYRPNMENYVRMVEKPYRREDRFTEDDPDLRTVRLQASACQFCEQPACMAQTSLNIRGLLRRVMVGNLTGARRLLTQADPADVDDSALSDSEVRCIRRSIDGQPVAIRAVVQYLQQTNWPDQP